MRRKDREVTNIEEIEEILKLCKTAHLGMIDGEMPYVIPLSYGYEMNGSELTVYFHCATVGKKIDILLKNPKVCFEISDEGEPVHVDTPCNSGYYYSSIIGNGIAQFIEEVSEKCHALSCMYERQSGQKIEFKEQQANTVACFKVTTTDYHAKRKPKL